MDPALLPHPVFPSLLTLLPLSQRLKLCRVSGQWKDLVDATVTDLCLASSVKTLVHHEGKGRDVLFFTTKRVNKLGALFERWQGLKSLVILHTGELSMLSGQLESLPTSLKRLKLEGVNYSSLTQIFNLLTALPCSLSRITIPWLPFAVRTQEGEEGLFKMAERHGDTLTHFKAATGARISGARCCDFFNETRLATFSEKAPKLESFNMVGKHWRLFPNLKTIQLSSGCENLSEEMVLQLLEAGIKIRCCETKDLPTAWNYLSCPFIRNLKKISSPDALDHTNDPDEPFAKLLKTLEKNRYTLRYLCANFNPSQVIFAAPSLSHVTHLVLTAGSRLSLSGWVALGAELKSLKNLEAHVSLSREQISAWTSEMPPRTPLEIAIFDSQTGEIDLLAERLFPRCPYLAYLQTYYRWCDHDLHAIAKFSTCQLRGMKLGKITSAQLTQFLETNGEKLIYLNVASEIVDEEIALALQQYCKNFRILELANRRNLSKVFKLMKTYLPKCAVTNISV